MEVFHKDSTQRFFREANNSASHVLTVDKVTLLVSRKHQQLLWNLQYNGGQTLQRSEMVVPFSRLRHAGLIYILEMMEEDFVCIYATLRPSALRVGAPALELLCNSTMTSSYVVLKTYNVWGWKSHGDLRIGFLQSPVLSTC